MRVCKAWVGSLVVASFVAGAVAEPITVTEIDRREQGRDIRGWVAIVDLTDPSVELVVTAPTPGPEEAVLTRTDLWRSANNLTLAVNANFFGSFGDGTADIIGLSVTDGQVVSPVRVFEGQPDPVFVLKSDGTAVVDRLDSAVLPVAVDAVAGVGGSSTDSDPGTLLVSDGVNTGATARVQPASRNPRTAIGVNQAGTQAIIMVIDGRQPNHSDGVTLPKLADLMIEFGAWDAVNLDGGGSSSFIYNDGENHFENRPSDGQHRAVANHLGVRISTAGTGGVQDDRPIRGAWWRPEGTNTTLEQRLAQLAESGITDLFLETFYHGLATNDSDVFNDRFSYDYLAETIARAPKHGIRVHAWLEAAYWSFSGSGNYILDANPDWKVTDDEGNTNIGDQPGQIFVNLGHPGVQQMLSDYCTELATNYPMLWGLHTDYHRFPLDNDLGDNQIGPYSFDAWSRTEFQSQFGVDPLTSARLPGDPFYDEFVAFRRDGIAQAARVMNDAIQAADPGKLFSGAIFATAIADRFGNPNPSQFVKMQDWPTMAANGWLPIVVPMAYGSSTTSIRNDLIAANNQKGPAKVAAGLAIINPTTRPGVTDQLNTVYGENIDSFVWFEANVLTSSSARRLEHKNYLLANGPFQAADFDQNLKVGPEDWAFFFSLYTGTPFPTGLPLDLDGDGLLGPSDEALFLDAFRKFRFGADGRVGQREYEAVLASFTPAGETWPDHLYDLTGDGVVDCADVSRLRRILTDEVSPITNPDLDADGDADEADHAVMAGWIESADPRADLNADGACDYFDMLLYVGATADQCP
ncbi:MAG: phosphodiester glycosidase family protein [Phycisphaerales bacterium]